MLINGFRVAVTLALTAAAVFLGAALWRYYMVSPWTRDGRVRAEVVDLAPEVAGTVVALDARDNQFVHKGDSLAQVDPTRFRLAVALAEAELARRSQELRIRAADARRRAGLRDVVSTEEIERFDSAARVAAAAVDAARASLDLARLNLDRARLRSPVNGYVTNLHLRVGDYISVGEPRIAVLDADSFWIVGYFDETRLRAIHLGDPALVLLMGNPAPLSAHVESIGRGVSDPNTRPDAFGLPDVNPVFSWVRLAQRIPVRLHIDRVPAGVNLVAGTTCTVTVGAGRGRVPGDLRPGQRAWIGETLVWLGEILN